MTKYINLKTKRGSARDKALTPTEKRKVENELKHEQTRVAYYLAAYAGLRPGEVCQCRFSWLEFLYINEEEVLAIHIPKEDKDSRNKKKIWRPKRDKARTTYIFNLKVAYEIYFWLKSNPDGLQISRQALDTRIKKFIGIIIGRNISGHALRATAQNYLRNELGLEPLFIQYVLGHEDPKTTLEHYNTLNRANMESYLERELKTKKN